MMRTPGRLMRVLDLTDESAVYATRLLTDLGADVIRVEPPRPDGVRRWRLPDVADGDPAAGGPLHACFNAGKRSVALDLTTREGVEVFDGLCAAADLVIEGLTPMGPHGPMPAAPEGSPTHLVWVSVRDDRDSPGDSPEIIRYARSGLMSITGHPGGPPVLVGGGLADAVVAVTAAAAAYLGWFASQRAGRGLRVVVDAYEALTAVMAQGLLQASNDGTSAGRQGGRHGHIAVAGAVPCRDGHVVVSASMPSMWTALVQLIGDARLTDAALDDERERARRQAEIFDVITGWAVSRSKGEIAEVAQSRHIATAPVQDLVDLLSDPQLLARGVFAPARGGALAAWRTPWSEPPAPAPALGQHTAEVLREIGLEPERLRQLDEHGVILLPRHAPEMTHEAVARDPAR